MDEKRMGELKQLREKLYESLSQNEFSIEVLAKHLKPHYEEISEEELIEKLKGLQSGMANGRAIFGDLYEKYVEGEEDIDMPKLVREAADEKLKDVPEEKQRDALCKIAECLCGDKLSDDAASMSLNELKDKVCLLVCYTNFAEILKILNSMPKATDTEQNAENAESGEFKEYEEKFSEEERDLIDAAAAYTIMRKDAGVGEEEFGEQFTIQQSAMRRVIKNETLDVILRVISIACFAASIFALVHALSVLFEEELIILAIGCSVYPAFFYIIDPMAMIETIKEFFSLSGLVYDMLTEVPFIQKHLFAYYEETEEALCREKQTMIAGSEEDTVIEEDEYGEDDYEYEDEYEEDELTQNAAVVEA